MSTLIQICGASYCGSTLLGMLLGRSPGVVFAGELSARFRPWRVAHHTHGCACGTRPCEEWDWVSEQVETDCHAAFLRRYGAATVIDASKDMRWLVESRGWAAASGLAVQTLVAWKDPIWHDYSFWKRGRPIEQARAAFVQYHATLFELGLALRTVSYQQLVDTPKETLLRVCGACHLEYAPEQEHFWDLPSHHSFGDPSVAADIGSPTAAIRRPESLPIEFLRDARRADRRGLLAEAVEAVAATLVRLDVASDGPRRASRPTAFEPYLRLRARLQGLSGRLAWRLPKLRHAS
jgi:hypothetical protein